MHCYRALTLALARLSCLDPRAPQGTETTLTLTLSYITHLRLSAE